MNVFRVYSWSIDNRFVVYVYFCSRCIYEVNIYCVNVIIILQSVKDLRSFLFLAKPCQNY